MRYLLVFCFLMNWVVVYTQQDLEELANSIMKEGKYEAAYEEYKKVSEVYFSQGELLSYVDVKLKMADCKIQSGDPFTARTLASNAITFISESLSKNLNALAKAKTLLGISYLNLGRNNEALEVLLEAEKLFQEDNPEKGRCLDAIGQVYTNNENYQFASQYLEQGLKIRRKILGPQSVEVGNSYNNLGRVFAVNDPLQAIIYFNRAQGIYEKSLGSSDRRTLRAKINIAFANREQGNYEEALKILKQVKTIYQKSFGSQNSNVAYIQSIIGRIQKDQEDYDGSLVSLNDALQTYLNLYGEKYQEVSNAYYLIGEVYRAKSEYRTSLTFYQKAIYANLPGQEPMDDYDLPELVNYLNPDYLLSSLTAKAYALEFLHYQKTLNVKDLVGAVETYIKCDELITLIRRKRLNEQDKIRLGATAKDIYENGIQLSLNLSEGTFNKKKYLAKAFEFCERGKSAVLLEAITESDAKEFSGIPSELIALEDSLKDEISFLEKELASDENADDGNLKDLLFSYQNSYRNFISNLESNYPDYYQLKYDQSISTVEEIQSKITENTALLSYFLGEDEIYVFIITSNRIVAERFPKTDQFERFTKGLRNAIKYKIEDAFIESSKSLYTQLIPKLKPNINELIILPDGILGTIPFEVLINPKEAGDHYTNYSYLIKDYHISYDYSATLFVQRVQSEQVDDPQILLVAPIDFSDNELQMTSLPGSEKEIEEIKLLFQGNDCIPTIQLGKEASESNFKDEPLSNYRFVHFATHGLVNESEPSLSRIFLSPDQQQDGSLYTGEIYNLDFNADLVTLSACETGLGKVAKGEGVVGLSRALQYAGANNIIVSLWQVADESTADMMIEFYKYNLYNDHHGYNTALRRAKLSLLTSEKYNQPFYWAPFILVGM